MGGIYSYIIPIKKYFTIPKYFDKLRSFRNARINDRNEEKYSQIKSKLSWLPEFSKRERGIGTDEGSLYLQELTRVSKEIGVDISHLSLRPTNLEDVFFYVTGRSFV